MEKEGKYSKNLRVRVDPELYEEIREASNKLDVDMSTYVRWCIKTGLYLKDVNKEIKSEDKKP
jgi:predicted HicB family RNase H-like nuclease